MKLATFALKKVETDRRDEKNATYIIYYILTHIEKFSVGKNYFCNKMKFFIAKKY